MAALNNYQISILLYSELIQLEYIIMLLDTVFNRESEIAMGVSYTLFSIIGKFLSDTFFKGQINLKVYVN